MYLYNAYGYVCKKEKIHRKQIYLYIYCHRKIVIIVFKEKNLKILYMGPHL